MFRVFVNLSHGVVTTGSDNYLRRSGTNVYLVSIFMTDKLSLAFHVFPMYMLISFSVDEILMPYAKQVC